MTWTLAYNARCGVAALLGGWAATRGPAADLLETYGAGYLGLRW